VERGRGRQRERERGRERGREGGRESERERERERGQEGGWLTKDFSNVGGTGVAKAVKGKTQVLD
jgi:hypothetical protein